MLIHISKRLRNRFVKHIETRGGQDSCWRWKGTVDSAGYGVFTLGRKGRIAAHRMAAIFARTKDGDIYDTNDLPLMGHHDNCIGNRCVNPEHLTPGRYTNRKYGKDEEYDVQDP